MNLQLYPYVVFLPPEHKGKILSAIFGSKAAADVLKFALSQGISNKIYQKNLIKRLSYSNKTIIENLKVLTKLGILEEYMEKTAQCGRVVWVKTYRLSDVGKWFALLLAEDKDLSGKEKAEILQNIFRTYIKWVRDLSEKLNVNKKALEEIFREEMK
ncbi:MAG: hypothetical protein QW270_03210 [Candidatus Bathyarchaeia archaeon]